MPVAAVGFDLGETLLTYADTPLSWVAHYPAALACVAADCTLTLSADDLARATDILARHNTRLHPRRNEVPAAVIFREILETWKLPPERWLPVATAAFFGYFQQRMQPYPETGGVLAALRGRAIRIGVLTDVPYGMSREFVQRDLAGAKIETSIDVLLTSVEVGWRKPEAAGFRALAQELRVDAGDLWFVGNEEKDMAGARAAGATAILIDRGGAAPAWGQHHTLRNLQELLPLL